MALPGSYVRVHVSPKRHLRATQRRWQVDWASRILDTTADFVVVDKPQGPHFLDIALCFSNVRSVTNVGCAVTRCSDSTNGRGSLSSVLDSCCATVDTEKGSWCGQVDNLKECVLYQVSQLVNEDLLVTR
eukprot:1305310-Rhodomonas_salina.3